MGIEDNTIVIYTTDNGNELMLWPDGGYAPFRGEKGTTWEGGLRVPMLIKYPGVIKPGSDFNGLQSHEDIFVTLASIAGLPNLKEDLLKGYKMGDMTYKVHLDGYDRSIVFPSILISLHLEQNSLHPFGLSIPCPVC